VPLLKIRCEDRNPSSDWEYTVFNYVKVQVKLSLGMPRKHMGEWRYSSMYSSGQC
jgi:hypothetical protein